MPTEFEFIEINDNAQVGRKIAGDFETQGADSIFHQTARNLNTRLEEATGVTLSTTPTDIALNGMESHVIVDVGASTGGLRISLQYVTGGDFYACNYDPLVPIVTRTGVRDVDTTAPVVGGYLPTDYDSGNPLSGSHVFAIPTNGAKTLRLTTASGSIADVAWARVVLSSPPYQHAITKAVTRKSVNNMSFIQAAQPYANNEFLGAHVDITPFTFTGAESSAFVTLQDIYCPYESGVLPDFDLVIGSSFLTAVDGALWDGSGLSDSYGVIQFRASPSAGQYPIIPVGTGGSVAMAKGVNLTPYYPFWELDGVNYHAVMVARSAWTTDGFIRFYYTWDAG